MKEVTIEWTDERNIQLSWHHNNHRSSVGAMANESTKNGTGKDTTSREGLYWGVHYIVYDRGGTTCLNSILL